LSADFHDPDNGFIAGRWVLDPVAGAEGQLVALPPRI